MPIHQGPWGKPPEDKGGRRKSSKDQEQFDDFMKNAQDGFKKMWGGGNGGSKRRKGKNPLPFIVIVVLILWLLSGAFRVQPGEQGVKLVFGEWINEGALAKEGLHYNFPSPIGRTEVLNTAADRKVTIGYVDLGRAGSSKRDIPAESLMLTGDEKIVDIDFRVSWDIMDAGLFLFRVKDPEGAVKRASESSMREIIGKSPISLVLSDKRADIEQQVAQRIQELMDNYQTGIRIREVLLEAANPPESVVDAYLEVQRAQTDANTAKNKAEAYALAILPQAEGRAISIKNEAQGYRDQVINKATGDAKRFNQVFQAYSAAPDITKKRLYLETMEDILQNANKIITDGNGNTAPLLPLYLNQTSKPATGK